MNKVTIRIKMIVALCALMFATLIAGVFTISRTAHAVSTSSIVIVNDAVRVQALSDTLVRIEVKGPKGFEDRASYYVVNRDWDGVNTTVTEEDGVTAIATSTYTVHVPSNAFDLSGVYITDNKSGAKIWEFLGETTGNVYLPSASDELSCWYLSDSPRVIPSDLGYSVDKDNEYGSLQGWDYSNASTDMYVFLPHGSYKQFMKDYTTLTGSAEMVELQTLGYWDSRYYAYSSETALKQITDYLDQGYNSDGLVIDTDWRDASSGWGYDINTSLFPNMSKFLDECENLGVNIIFNDHPEPVGGTQNGLEEDEVEYRNKNLTLLLSLGLDYWWYDRNWGVCLKPFDDEVSVFAFGMYCYQWITKDYLESITDIGEYAKRAIIMGNVDGCLNGKWKYASDASAHRYSIQWTGDIGADSTALAQEIYTTIFGGVEVGLPYMSSDIGGHTAPVTDSMYVRWTQYGALSPIYRVHCTKASSIDGQIGRMPWLFGERAENVAKTYVQMRYRLLPLYYNLAHEAYSEGLPLVRRLDILYPQYVEASANDEYLLGDNILVAPIAEAEVSERVPDSWLTHEENGKTVSGLKAAYYTGTNLSGAPKKTKTDSNVFFNWGMGGPDGVGGIGTDNFSVRWSGKITFGKGARLAFVCDDGVRVKIDGQLVLDGWPAVGKLLTTPYYDGGETHDITIEFHDEYGDAYIYMYYRECDADDNYHSTRDVFIPDGTWIDVWSGKKYAGPQMISVKHSLDTSPIFVREGSIVALAENMQQTSEKDWHNMTLDVYPSKNYPSSQTVYEDDTETVGYKDGKFRTTFVESGYNADKDAITVKINAAEGKFDGALAFEKRNWKIRIHAYETWGKVTKAIVNGKEVKTLYYAKDPTAQPFARSGGSSDSDIYEIEFSGDIYKDCEILVWFEHILQTEKNEAYDATSIDFDAELMDVNEKANLTEEGDIDWIFFGKSNANSVDKKANGTTAFDNLNLKAFENNISEYSGSFTAFSWTDGNNGSTAGTTGGIAGKKDFTFTVNTIGRDAYYTVYVSSYKATAKLTVRDRAGNVKTFIFGNMNGNYTGRVVIHVTSEEQSQLYFTLATYSVQQESATSYQCKSYVALNAMIIGSKVKETEVAKVNVTVKEKSAEYASGSVNLTDNGQDLNASTVDWTYNASYGGSNRTGKTNADSITNTVFNENNGIGQSFDDFKASFTWSDGDPVLSSDGTTKGFCSNGRSEFKVKITAGKNYLRIYTGVWQATNTIYVYNKQNKLLCKTTPFSAGETSVCKVITLEIDADADTILTVAVEASNATSSGGNVSLPAITLLKSESEQTAVVDVAGNKSETQDDTPAI